MDYAKFRLGRALLDDLYESGKPDDHKRLGGPKDMNGLDGHDKLNDSIRPNDPKNLSEPDDPNGVGGPNDLMSQVDPKTRTGHASSKI